MVMMTKKREVVVSHDCPDMSTLNLRGSLFVWHKLAYNLSKVLNSLVMTIRVLQRAYDEIRIITVDRVGWMWM